MSAPDPAALDAAEAAEQAAIAAFEAAAAANSAALTAQLTLAQSALATSQAALAAETAKDATDQATIVTLQAQIAALQHAAVPASPSSLYKTPTFYEPFAGGTLDASRWNVNQMRLDYELSESIPGNVVVNNGLTLRAKKEPSPNGRPWTSAYIDTKGKFAQKYGYFEVCFWAAEQTETTAGGLWDAPLWLRTTDGSTGEIDVAEFWGKSTNKTTSQVYPTGGGYASLLADTDHHDNRKSTITIMPKAGRFSDGYHRVGVEWSPNGIGIYVDGVLTSPGVVPNSGLGVIGGNKNGQPFLPTVYGGPMHLRIQRQVGQLLNKYPDPTPGYWGTPDANTALDSTLLVQYVVVYS
jgi:beta-glucanase (GH16 family)